MEPLELREGRTIGECTSMELSRSRKDRTTRVYPKTESHDYTKELR
jgi:hypothetical protein